MTDTTAPTIQLDPDREAGAELFALVRRSTAWLDATNGDSEAEVRLRILKVMEEAGEVAQAVIGAAGQNPRKGRTHDVDDIARELVDVAVTALVALQSLRYADVAAVVVREATKVGRRLDEMGVTAHPGERKWPQDRSTDVRYEATPDTPEQIVADLVGPLYERRALAHPEPPADPRAEMRDRIASALHAAECGCADYRPGDAAADSYRRQADAVMGLFPEVVKERQGMTDSWFGYEIPKARAARYVLRTAPEPIWKAVDG